MRRFLFAFAVMTAPLHAEEVDPNTPAGRARIVEGGDSGVKALALGGNHVIDLPTAPWIAFLEARRGGDLLLVGLSQGGNACGASYAWVHTTPPDDLRVSEAFGTCNELVGVSHDAETVRVRLKGGEPGKGGDVTFLYDGRTVTRRQEALHPSGGQGNQGGADYWVGRYAFELLHAAELQVPLRAIMGDDALLALQSTVRMTSPMRIEGDWVIGEGGYVKYQPP